MEYKFQKVQVVAGCPPFFCTLCTKEIIDSFVVHSIEKDFIGTRHFCKECKEAIKNGWSDER